MRWEDAGGEGMYLSGASDVLQLHRCHRPFNIRRHSSGKRASLGSSLAPQLSLCGAELKEAGRVGGQVAFLFLVILLVFLIVRHIFVMVIRLGRLIGRLPVLIVLVTLLVTLLVPLIGLLIVLSVALIRRVIRRLLVRSVLVHHQFLVTGWQFCSCQEMFLRTASSWSQAGSSDVIQMHDLMQFTGMC